MLQVGTMRVTFLEQLVCNKTTSNNKKATHKVAFLHFRAELVCFLH